MSVRAAMRRIAEADRARRNEDDREQQHESYEKTLRALAEIDADDNDEGITVVTEWIIEQIETEGTRPSSRAVRRRAREFCENNGYEVPNDAWLGR